MADSKKLSFLKSSILNISWIGPWVSGINSCEGHQCGSPYMVVRLSDKRCETGKKQKAERPWLEKRTEREMDNIQNSNVVSEL